MQETNEYYLDLARQYIDEGLVHKAQGIALTFRHNAPRDADFHMEWAELCAELGLTKQARESYEQAIYLAPDHAENITTYASLLYDLGNYEEAIHYLKKAIKKAPGFQKARDLLAEVYLSLGLDGLAAALRPRRAEKVLSPRTFPPSIGRSDVERFLDLWADQETRFAIQKIDTQRGSLTYDFYDRPITAEEVAQHIKGDITLAGLPLRLDKTVRFGIIEIRIRRRVMENNLKNTGFLTYLNENGREHGLSLRKLARLNNLQAYVEDTGDHCHRLWFFFQEPVHFLKIKSFLKRFLKEANIFDSRFQIEPLLPTQGTGLGWVEEPIFLPLGIHRRTMRRSLFINEEESRPYTEQLKFLKKIRPIPFSEALKGFHRYFTPGLKGDDVRLDVLTLKLMNKCPVLNTLCHKALQGKPLPYAEKVILFYSVGLVDPDGLSLHRLLEASPVYQYEKVEKQRVRLKQNPISCLKIRELVPGIATSVSCCCSFDLRNGHYPSPLLYINPHLVPVNPDLAVPDKMAVREAARRLIRLTDQMEELKKGLEKIGAILDRHYADTGLERIDIGSKTVFRRERNKTGPWTVEFRS